MQVEGNKHITNADNQLFKRAILLFSILLLYCAYAFDHKRLLALGITSFISTMVLSIAPMHMQLLNGDNFTDSTLLITALALGITLILIAVNSNLRGIKRHFIFSYHHFAVTLLFVACCLSGISFQLPL